MLVCKISWVNCDDDIGRMRRQARSEKTALGGSVPAIFVWNLKVNLVQTRLIRCKYIQSCKVKETSISTQYLLIFFPLHSGVKRRHSFSKLHVILDYSFHVSGGHYRRRHNSVLNSHVIILNRPRKVQLCSILTNSY